MYYNLITHISNNIICKYSEILVRDKIEMTEAGGSCIVGCLKRS